MPANRSWTREERLLFAQTGRKPSDSLSNRLMPNVGVVHAHRDVLNRVPVEYVKSQARSEVLQVVVGNTVSSRITLVRGK